MIGAHVLYSPGAGREFVLLRGWQCARGNVVVDVVAVFGDDAATVVLRFWEVQSNGGGGGKVRSFEWEEIMMRWWCHGLLPALR